MKLIDKDALIEAIGEEPEVWMPDDYAQGLHDQWVYDLGAINSLPEIKSWSYWKGVARWTYDRPHHWFCSSCKTMQGMTARIMNYCPQCGARMEGGDFD